MGIHKYLGSNWKVLGVLKYVLIYLNIWNEEWKCGGNK